MFMNHLESAKEDSVECWIFNDNLQSENVEFISQVCSTVSDITKGYIWHKDSFSVHLPVAIQDSLPPHLHSVTFYGDNIEDEWFIVYVIMELTKKYNNTVVQVQDNDGEFLLIEAAGALPSWASPDTTENRVFIMNGDVHMIPPELVNLDTFISVKDAVECIKINSQLTLLNDSVQFAIKKRINGYPDQIQMNLHNACVRLPLKYAGVLTIEPSLISHVVHAYCNRDSVESNICKKTEIENCVDVNVTFTKCLYAMLIHSNLLYKASWKLPPTSSDLHKKSMLGVKLACGFDILLSKATHDTFNSKQWNTFIESLKNNGYFKDNLEGSKDYLTLLQAAKNYFLTKECVNINSHLGNTVKQTMNRPDFSKICEQITLNHQIQEDSDDWLNIDPDELNTLLNEQYGKTKKFMKGEMITPKTITDELSSFLNQASNLEGIEIGEENDHEDIEFNYENFTDCVKNILDSLDEKNDSDFDSDMCDESDDDDENHAARQYQQGMEEELSKSTMSQSFIKDGATVDVRKNAYTNFLQSVKEEKGGSGPSSNLLSTMGLFKTSLPALDSDDEEFETKQ